LRSSIGEERLTGLALAYIHRDIDVADLPLTMTLALTKQWTFLSICLQQSNVR